MNQVEDRFGCTDRMAELCALATAGALTADESRILEAHLVSCPDCVSLMAEYRELTIDAMATVAAAHHRPGSSDIPKWKRGAAKRAFMAAVGAETPPWRHRLQALLPLSQPAWANVAIATAILIVVVASGVSFRLGYKQAIQTGNRIGNSSQLLNASLSRQLESTSAERDALKREVAEATSHADALHEQEAHAEKQILDLETAKASISRRLDAVTAQDQQQASTVTQLTADKQSLQQQLQAAEETLRTVRLDLDGVQQERQRAVLRAASLQSEVDRLSSQMNDVQQSSDRQLQYLASDRDVRELMGARQLYIADVFDVDARGKPKKPFGRVFYTKGKSLIFYAFDLDREPGYREAKAFQAWGRSGATQAKPVSLGILYMDNESNRRWALKFDDPKVLDEINAVFVTVEPSGGSKRPTTKPFLLAYLHSASVNHP